MPEQLPTSTPEINETEPREARLLGTFDEEQLYNGWPGFEPQATVFTRVYGPEGKDGGWYAETAEPTSEGKNQAELEAEQFRLATAALQNSVAGVTKKYEGPTGGRHANVLPSYDVYVTPAGEARFAAFNQSQE